MWKCWESSPQALQTLPASVGPPEPELSSLTFPCTNPCSLPVALPEHLQKAKHRDGGEIKGKGDQDMEPGALPPLLRHGPGPVPGRDSCCGGGRLQSRRNSLETAPPYTPTSHRSCPWNLVMGGRTWNLWDQGQIRGEKGNLCLGGCPELPPPSLSLAITDCSWNWLLPLPAPNPWHRALNTPSQTAQG